jgi:phage recombination protein Bet
MTTQNSSMVVAAEPIQEHRLRFTAEDKNLILDTCMGGASKEEAIPLIALAELRGLNPLEGECHFVKQWDSAKGRQVWSIRISIDAMRSRAEETGLYCGQDEPEYEYDEGKNYRETPRLARVKVYRRDWSRPCVAVARYDEYVQTTNEGKPNKMWAKMSHNQLAKCAEALALRKAFPRQLAKLYTQDEMAQAENVAEHETRRVAPDVTVTHRTVARTEMRVDPPLIYNPSTGEIVQVEEATNAKAASQVDRYAGHEAALLRCKTRDDLRQAWVAVCDDKKTDRITNKQAADLTQQRKLREKAIEAAAREEATDEAILADTEAGQ